VLRDPLTRWSGRFPYDVLAPAGITPESTLQEVRDVSFELMAAGRMTAEVRRAWDELRSLPRRLLVDFLLYPVDLPAEIAAARDGIEADLRRWGEAPDPSAWLEVAWDDLLLLEAELGNLPGGPEEVPYPEPLESAFDSALSMLGDGFGEFDR